MLIPDWFTIPPFIKQTTQLHTGKFGPAEHSGPQRGGLCTLGTTAAVKKKPNLFASLEEKESGKIIDVSKVL